MNSILWNVPLLVTSLRSFSTIRNESQTEVNEHAGGDIFHLHQGQE
jgi:hypothetical protein